MKYSQFFTLVAILTCAPHLGTGAAMALSGVSLLLGIISLVKE